MKRGLLVVLGILSLFVGTALASAQVAVLGNERVTVHEDLTYDVAFAFDFSSTYFFDEKNWSFDFDKNLENFVVYDDLGILQTAPIVEKNGWKAVRFDARYTSKGVSKKLYVNATGKLVVPSSKVARLTYGAYTFDGGKIFDYLLNVTVSYPQSLSFISTDEEKKVSKALDDERGTFSITLLNPGAYRALAFVKRDTRSEFLEIREGKQTFFVQNDSRLIEAFARAKPYFSLIRAYPSHEDTLTLALASMDTLEYQPDSETTYDGSYVTDNLILLSDRIRNSDELSSVLLHELTHYAQFSSPSRTLYSNIEWLREGEGVYTEIRYIEQRFPEYNGTIPGSLNFYQRMIDPVLLSEWYEQGKEFANLSAEDGFSGGDLYSIYGFILHHYISTSGVQAFADALQKTTEEIDTQQKNYNVFTSAGQAESLLLKHLAESQSLQREELFFPQRALYFSDKKQFEEQMRPFVAQPLSAEQLNDLLGTGGETSPVKNSERESSGGLLLWVVLASILLVILLVLGIVLKRRSS